MSTTLNQELALTYVKDYYSFTEELPNELSTIFSDIFVLDGKIRQKMDKIDYNISKLERKNKMRYSNRIEKYLHRIKKFTKKQVKLSNKLKDLIEKHGKQLTEDYECMLLSNQSETFTYGTRNGKLWNK